MVILNYDVCCYHENDESCTRVLEHFIWRVLIALPWPPWLDQEISCWMIVYSGLWSFSRVWMLDFFFFFWTCTVSSMSLQNSSEAVDAPWLRFCARNQKFNWWAHVPGFPESHWLIVWGKPSTAQLYAVGCIVPLLEALDQLFATNVSWLMPVSNLWERVYKKKKKSEISRHNPGLWVISD